MPKKTLTKNLVPRDKVYENLLTELKSIIAKGQSYWQLGERIVREEFKHQDRADYEQYLINNLGFFVQILFRPQVK